jgi:hypothetical protein
MTRRHSRHGGLQDPIPVLEKLRPGREAIIAELRNVRPTSPHYHMLHVCLSAIDTAAEFFTGHRYYFLNPNPDQIGRSRLPDA